MTLVMWDDARHVSWGSPAFNPVMKSLVVRCSGGDPDGLLQRIKCGFRHWNRKAARPIIFVNKTPC